MKSLNFLSLIIAAGMLLLGCSEDYLPNVSPDSGDQVSSSLKSAKPSSNLTGITYTTFTLTPPTFWNGTIDFGDQGLYAITFISYTPPRDYSQASPFEEDFIIYTLGGDWTLDKDVVMRGSNKGVVTYANQAPDPVRFHANGKIEQASGPFQMWVGRNWHIKGVVHWVGVGLPEYATTQVRIK